jgi:predicted DNA-binding transcriptional regulator YafY
VEFAFSLPQDVEPVRIAPDAATFRLELPGGQDALSRQVGATGELVPAEGGAYRLTPGFKLPPMMFSDDEAVALSLGLLFAKRFPVASSGAGAQSAQIKLERVLPTGLRAKLRALSSTVQLDLAPAPASVPQETLLTLSTAAHGRQRVHLRYGSAKNEISERDFDCYGLAWRGGQWYAVGYCHLRAGLRSFRLDRMQSVAAVPANFTPPENFDAARHLALGLASLPRAHAVCVRLKTDIASARQALFDVIGLFQPVGDEVLLYSQVDDLDWYARQLARLPFDFAVVEPATLRQAVRNVAVRLRRLVA